jgi:phage terminase large subunit-like protein
VDIFSQLPKSHKPRFVESKKKMFFPSGSTLKYNHMEYEKDKRSHQGLAYDYLVFDEATHFSFTQIEYLMSRMRGKSKFKSRMILTANPDPDSWLLEMIDWYLDDEGYPDEAKQGVIRYFLRRNGKFIWSESREDLIEKYRTPTKLPSPKSFTFIGSKLIDNPVLMEVSLEYEEWLDSLNKIDKARLRDGNWYLRAEGSNYFSRKDLQKADRIPKGAACVRAWDKASTEVSEQNPYPDYTACIKMYKTENNEFYITGEFDRQNFDGGARGDPDVFGHFRCKPGKRENLILRQAESDGPDCIIIMPVDPGAHGVTEYQESAKKLAIHGFIVKKDVVAPQRSKLQKFVPFSASCENGIVYIVESTFNKATLEAFYKELEAFDGKRSGKLRKDDY